MASGARCRSAEARLSMSCCVFRAPMIAATTPGRLRTQLSATWAGEMPVSSATWRTASTEAQVRSEVS